jgi:hypothetical protein
MKESNIEERLAICKKCPIFTIDGRCNSKLWLNPDTNEVSTYAKIGYIRGCNCIIKVKARNPYNHCIAGKW